MPAVKASKKSNTYPRIKKVEFNLFVELMESGPVEHLYQIAEMIGVASETLSDWKKTPEVQTAIANGVRKSFVEMEKAGKRDWRMWESKLKLLGFVPVQKTDVTSKGEKIIPIINLDALSSDTTERQEETPSVLALSYNATKVSKS